MESRKRMRRTINIKGQATDLALAVCEIFAASKGGDAKDIAEKVVDEIGRHLVKIDTSAYADGYEDGYSEKLS